MAVRLSTSARNALAGAVATLADAGPAAATLKIYSGTQPATPDTAASGTLLATVAMGDPSFGTASSGTITAADPAPVSGVAAGTAGWFRLSDSTGAAVIDGSVTATGGGGDLTLTTTTISVGVSVDITSFTVTMPGA
jgi:hypothetical protein